MPERIWDVGFDWSILAANDTASAKTSRFTWNFTVHLSREWLPNSPTQLEGSSFKSGKLIVIASFNISLYINSSNSLCGICA
jgi:hypothetical protein